MSWQDWLAALSLANLVYLRLWTELLTTNAPAMYWLKTPPIPAHYIALMINVILLSLVLLVGIGGLRKRSRLALRLMPVFGLAILVSLVNSLRTLIGRPGNSMFLRFVEQRAPAIGVGITILIVCALMFGGLRALRPVYHLLLLLSPFVVLSFGQAIGRMAAYDTSSTEDGPMAARLPAKPAGAPRVVWVIFDEWDQDLTFGERPARIAMPEVDRFRDGAFEAMDVQTANTMTDWSMPALIDGEPVHQVLSKGPSELMIQPADSSQWVPWSRQDNVFRDARQLGFNTAVVAWALPYCRVLKSDLSDCWWLAGSNQYNSNGDTLPQILLNQPRSLYENIYRSPFGQSLSTRRHAELYHTVMSKALEAVRDPGHGLTLLHLPAPHPPYFYNARTERDDLNDTPGIGIFRQTQQGYLDALALTDRSLGMLRRAMEQAGVWDSTTVIFS
ncbi:MAG TPA: sulfatase-like hydrolase/transferase, partial [Candidatus Binataceae bacterium]|nr:sulfatase-like hydrolase/transferase [Candidatus Binataceae bacterium]